MQRGRAWFVAALVWGAMPAAAQLVTLAPSAAVACLTPAAAERGEPEYPQMLYKAGKPGRVVAAATFQGTDFFPTPSITIDTQEGGDEFVEAVKKHLRTLRVPCLARNGKATLRFEFVFDPNSPRVYWSQPEDADDAARRVLLKCMVGSKNNKPPNYPVEALRQGLQGRLWAKLRFVAPDQPPEVQLHHRPSASPFAGEVEDWLRQRRLPCLQAEAVEAEFGFVYRLEGDVFGFRALTLLQYMGKVKGIAQQRVQFNTHEMGCPFDLRLSYRQPDALNRVGEVGERNPARRGLIEWLATSTLELNGPQLDSVYADTADISVPCVKIDLKPQEKTS